MCCAQEAVYGDPDFHRMERTRVKALHDAETEALARFITEKRQALLETSGNELQKAEARVQLREAQHELAKLREDEAMIADAQYNLTEAKLDLSAEKADALRRTAGQEDVAHYSREYEIARYALISPAISQIGGTGKFLSGESRC